MKMMLRQHRNLHFAKCKARGGWPGLHPHILRGGRPTAFDRLLAARFGVTAMERLMAGEQGVMVGLQGREINTIALADVCANKRRANLEYYRMARMLAK